MPSLNMPVQRLKVAILPLDLFYSGPVTHSGEIVTTGKSHEKKPDLEICKNIQNSDATLRLFGHEDERTFIFRNTMSYTLKDRTFISDFQISFDIQTYCINKNVNVIQKQGV